MDKGTIKTLKTLVEGMEEAQELLARKATLLKEIAELERRVEKGQAAVDAADNSLIEIRTKIAAEAARYDHEKKRYAEALKRQQDEMAEELKVRREGYAKDISNHTAIYQDTIASVAAKKHDLEKSISSLQAEHARLTQLVNDFKRRLSSTLPPE